MMQMLALVSNLTHANLNNSDTTSPLIKWVMCAAMYFNILTKILIQEYIINKIPNTEILGIEILVLAIFLIAKEP